MEARAHSGIDIYKVIAEAPNFQTHCSVEKLLELIDRLSRNAKFTVDTIGTSTQGVPIHHVRSGAGSIRALFVGGPHCMEPIGGSTAFSLLSLLSQGHPELLQTDVQWHVVPCLDPDGALLNEGWSQRPFTLERYVKEFYLQPRAEQVDFSFPISHKRLIFDRPSREALVLKGLLDRVRPQFFFSLHNYFAPMGGAWFALSRDIGAGYYRKLRELLDRCRMTLRTSAVAETPQFADGMTHLPTIRSHYDRLERQGMAIPEDYLRGRLGASSLEYQLDIEPDSLVFVAELPYGSHAGELSQQPIGQNLRQLKLQVFADNKFLASLILEAWDRVADDLDVASPFYTKIINDLVSMRGKIQDGVAEWYEPTLRSVMFDPTNDRQATERDLVQVCAVRTVFLASAHIFVRLLKASKQTPAVQQAIDRLESVFDAALANIKKRIDFSPLTLFDCSTLVRAQLGSGLIVLNWVLARRA